MVFVLALAAAFGWGASDYAAGRASRRSSVLSVVVLAHLMSVAAMCLVAIRWAPPHLVAVLGGDGRLFRLDVAMGVPTIIGDPHLADLLWGAAAGAAGGLGAALLFRGLTRGATALVAPISALGGAALPLAWAMCTGAALTSLSGAGLALGLVAILLVSMAAPAAPAAPTEPDLDSPHRPIDALARTAPEPTALLGAAPAPSAGPFLLPALDPSTSPLPRAHRPARSRNTAFRLIGVSAIAGPAAAAMPVIASLAEGRPLSGASALTLAFAVIASWTGLGGLALSRGLLAESRVGNGRVGNGRAGDRGTAQTHRRPALAIPGLFEALLSGIGFGLFFVFLDQTSADAGFWPLLSARSVSVVVFAVAAMASRVSLLPPRGSRAPAIIAGVLDAAATLLFTTAARSGALSVVVVLVSLFPAVTVVLARLIDHERLSVRQLAGLGVAAVAVCVLVLAR